MRHALIPVAAAAIVAACGPRDGAGSAAADSSAAAAAVPAESLATGAQLTPVPADTTSRKPVSSAAANSADTLRGVVILTGPAESATPVLRAEGGSTALGGPHSATLATLRGLEIWASGAIGPSPAGMLPNRVMTVDTFTVRAADGVPAMDGMLQAQGDQLMLTLSDGSREPVANPPDALRELIGHRIWIAQKNGETRGFGQIAPR